MLQMNPPKVNLSLTFIQRLHTMSTTVKWTIRSVIILVTGGSRGRIRGGPDPPIRPDAYLRLEFLHRLADFFFFNETHVAFYH